MNSNKQGTIVCLGGGIGTVNLISGLRRYSNAIVVVLSLADEGGSAGRLRRLYGLPPVGDLTSCIAAMIPDSRTAKLLRFRFPGDRYGPDGLLAGQKLGNLLLSGALLETGSLTQAIQQIQILTKANGTFLTATTEAVTIEADTKDGKHIVGEEAIDLGKYNGERVLSHISLNPQSPQTPEATVEAILTANTVIAGPGDLYTTILPVLIVPQVAQALIKSPAKKIFVVNVANKPFETRGYNVADFVQAVKKHLGCFPFSIVIANSNWAFPIPKSYHYTYVPLTELQNIVSPVPRLITADLVDEKFPLYHDQEKLASCLVKEL